MKGKKIVSDEPLPILNYNSWTFRLVPVFIRSQELEEPFMPKCHSKVRCTDWLAFCVLVLSWITLPLAVRAVQPPRVGDEQADISWQMKPRPSLRVVSGNLVYEEQLFKGGLRTQILVTEWAD